MGEVDRENDYADDGWQNLTETRSFISTTDIPEERNFRSLEEGHGYLGGNLPMFPRKLAWNTALKLPYTEFATNIRTKKLKVGKVDNDFVRSLPTLPAS